MPATTLRADLVILVGAFLGVSFLVTTLRQRASASVASRRSLHLLDTLARLLLGASLLLLALFELAGRTLWANSRKAPSWGGPAGIAILFVLLAAALVAGTFAFLHRARRGKQVHPHS